MDEQRTELVEGSIDIRKVYKMYDGEANDRNLQPNRRTVNGPGAVILINVKGRLANGCSVAVFQMRHKVYLRNKALEIWTCLRECMYAWMHTSL